MAALPPRRVVNVSRVNRQPSSPLQVLLQMGFPKHRAEKALAATGDRGVQLAADWLLAHVNDPTLDDSAPREYILYLCPTGPLLEQLQHFYSQSLLKCGWNGAHNYLPHITLCSFFQAPDDGISHLVHALKHVVEKLKLELPERIALEHYTSSSFLGLFVAEEHNDLLKRLAVQFMREVSDFRIQVEPYLKALHITLAYQFQPSHYSVLEELCRNINTNAAAGWELRLYSRDPRIKGNEVHKVLYSHVPQESDELELLIGDFVYVSGEQLANSADGWVEGTSWLTGCTGFLPKSYIERTSESDAWTLHKSLPLSKNASLEDIDQNTVARRPPITFLNQASEGNQDKPTGKSTTSSSKGAVQKDKTTTLKYPQVKRESVYENVDFSGTKTVKPRSEDQTPNTPKESLRQLYVVRHAERIDFTFGTWIPYCFDSSGNYTRKDLNMPTTVPHRTGGPQDFLKDCPLTNIGLYQATLTGEAMKEAGVSFSHVFCSPSLRCVQTGTNILKALGKDSSIPLCIEPGLFEWLAWYQDSMPVWMTPKELKDSGFNIKLEYRPLITQEELQDKQESSEQYYMRSFFVTQAVLKNTAGSNVLLIGHAATLDSCTRQLVSRSPRSANDLIHLVHKIPYCSVAVAEEDSDGSWSLVSPPFPPLMHSGTIRFDWKCLLT